MGRRTGFHSGEVRANRVKVNNRYINESTYIQQDDFSVVDVSGTAATFQTINSGTNQSIPSWVFGDAAEHHVSFRFIAPKSLKKNAAPNLKVYWTKAGSNSFGAVTWQADYWATKVYVSGVEAAGVSYNISGGITRTGTALGTGFVQQRASLVSGVIFVTDVKLDAAKISAGDLVKVQFGRFGVGPSDNLAENAHMFGILVEYVDG